MIKVTQRETTDTSSSTGWFKSSYSASNSSCVEIKFSDQVVLIRDTKNHGTGPTIALTAGPWRVFLRELTG